MCNCFKEVKENLLEKMQAEQGFTQVIEAPDFENKSIYPVEIPYFKITGKYYQKSRQRKFEKSLYSTYCPFCGEKINNQ